MKIITVVLVWKIQLGIYASQGAPDANGSVEEGLVGEDSLLQVELVLETVVPHP